MRFIGLDVHRDFCEVAVCEDGQIRSGPRVLTRPDALQAFANSLGPSDHVALEVTGNALSIARIIGPHVGRILLANPVALKAISQSKVKTDKVDARKLAKLLAAGILPEVWMPDERTRALRRRMSRRARLIKQRTALKNEVHGVLQRNLKERAPVSDLFGRGGRSWLQDQRLPEDEAETLEACLRQLEFLDAEVAAIDRRIAQMVHNDEQVRRLMTIPGVGMFAAVAFLATVGDVRRFKDARHLVGYLGFDPRVRQSGVGEARHGSISKQGSSLTRAMFVEAAWIASRSPGPLRAFAQRITARRGPNVAIVAVARKLSILCWHLLTREEDYAYQRPSLTRKKLRNVELLAGMPGHRRRRIGPRISSTAEERRLETDACLRAEAAYRSQVRSRRAPTKESAGAATRARIKALEAHAARQD